MMRGYRRPAQQRLVDPFASPSPPFAPDGSVTHVGTNLAEQEGIFPDQRSGTEASMDEKGMLLSG